MKKTLLLLTMTLPILLWGQNATPTGIKWETGLSWDQVKAKAKTENKYIFLDCYATWCAPCKLMDKEVYSSERIGTQINEKFISVKVQMDSNRNDDDQIKAWYVDSKKIQQEFKIQALPTYLFFTPEGRLVHSDFGYKDRSDFPRMATMARDPRKPKYYLMYEQYKRGEKNFDELAELAVFTKNLIGDKVVAQKMAKEYVYKVLNKLNKDSLLKKAIVNFYHHFSELIDSKGNFFQLLYNQPEKFDTLVADKGWVYNRVTETIIREEIENKILHDGAVMQKKPNWDKMQHSIKKQFKKVDAVQLMLSYKIGFYRRKQLNWKLWAQYKEERLRLFPPNQEKINQGWEAIGDLNQFGAWDAFLWCPDTSVLNIALKWIDIAIKFVPTTITYLDTKANLLYKLGRRAEALELQKKATELDPKDAEIARNYQKMQRGEPTWPEPIEAKPLK